MADVTVWQAVTQMFNDMALLSTPLTGTPMGATIVAMVMIIGLAFAINNGSKNLAISVYIIGIVVGIVTKTYSMLAIVFIVMIIHAALNSDVRSDAMKLWNKFKG